MEFFYTVSSQQNAIQNKPELSLGGFCSESKVPNGSFENLFSEISPYMMQKPKAEYIGLMLKNTTSTPISEISFWMNVPDDSICKFRLAIVETNDKGMMETIPSVNSKPLYADFHETSENNKIELSLSEALQVGDCMGIWIERTLNMESEQIKDRNNCDVLFQMFEQNQKWPTEETIQLKISYEL